MTLTELADKVEKAMGPDRELDALIQRAIRKPVPSDKWTNGSERVPQKPRYFTASIDAAMSLLDPTWFFHVSRFSPESDGRGQAHVYPNRGLGDDYAADAATPALALVAAALRAREAK